MVGARTKRRTGGGERRQAAAGGAGWQQYQNIVGTTPRGATQSYDIVAVRHRPLLPTCRFVLCIHHYTLTSLGMSGKAPVLCIVVVFVVAEKRPVSVSSLSRILNESLNSLASNRLNAAT
jgi:hypothetical protein